MTELKVTVMRIDNNQILLKVDDDLSFYVPMEEFSILDPKKEYRKGGSQLILKIENKEIKEILFDIFCYDENWHNFRDELEEILSGIKLKT